MHILLLALSVIVFFSCVQETPEGDVSVYNTEKAIVSGNEESLGASKKNISSEKSNDQKEKEAVIDRVSPSTARIGSGAKVTIGPSEIIADLDVPVLSYTLTKGDFTKIIRCATSYKFQTQLGEDVRFMGRSTADLVQKEWSWFQALGENRSCKIVSERVTTPKTPDLTAPNGNYYYVINPCFMKEHTLENKEDCSYDLAFTNSFEFAGSIREDMAKTARELADAEAELKALFQRTAYLAQLFEVKLRACEDRFAHDMHMNSLKTGLIQLGIFITGFSLGLLIGPNAAVMVAQLGSQFGAMSLTNHLGISTQLSNTCLVGEEAVKEGPSSMRGEAKILEENYNVVQVFNELVKIIGSSEAPGLIEQAKNNVTEKLKKLAEMNFRVFSINETFKNMGVKEGDPKALEDYIQSAGGNNQ